MKKRFFAVFIAFCMLLSLVPAGLTMADDKQTAEEISAAAEAVGGEEITKEDPAAEAALPDGQAEPGTDAETAADTETEEEAAKEQAEEPASEAEEVWEEIAEEAAPTGENPVLPAEDQTVVGKRAFIPAQTTVYYDFLAPDVFFILEADYTAEVEEAVTCGGDLWFRFATPIPDDPEGDFIWVNARDAQVEEETPEVGNEAPAAAAELPEAGNEAPAGVTEPSGNEDPAAAAELPENEDPAAAEELPATEEPAPEETPALMLGAEDLGLSFAGVDQSVVGMKACIPTGTTVYTKVLDLSEFYITEEEYTVNVVKAAIGYGTLWYKFASPIRDNEKVKYIWVRAEDVRLEGQPGIAWLEKSGVTVSGVLPAGAEIAVRSAAFEDVLALAPEFGDPGEVLKTLDISLLDLDGAELQPGSGAVAVSVNVSDVAENGEELLVFHVHENADGSVFTEELGFCVVENGEISFSMNSFSYIIVVKPVGGSQITVQNIVAFYTVSGTSNNNHFVAKCVYVDGNGDVHLILMGDHRKAATCKAVSATIDHVPVTTLKGTTNYGIVSQYEIQNADDTTDLTSFLTSSGYNYGVDINLGPVALSDDFVVDITWNDGTGGGFNIQDLEVVVGNDDGIQKTVYSVNGFPVHDLFAPEVKPGDEVIYRINIRNGRTGLIIYVDVRDILPAGLYNANAVYYAQSASGPWTLATVSGNTVTLGNSVPVAIGAEINYYVKITAAAAALPGTYTNTAEMTRVVLQITKRSTVNVVIPEPTTGTVSVTKEVVKAYDPDVIPDDSFLFELKQGSTAVSGLSYEITDASGGTRQGTLDSSGRFTLKNGETILIDGVPEGAYTVAELLTDTKYICGWTGGAVSVTVTAGEDTSVTCTNTLKKQRGDLTVTKSGWNAADAGQSFIFTITGKSGTATADISMQVVITGNGSVVIKDLPLGEYTVAEAESWSWRYTADSIKSVVIDADGETASFANTRDNAHWLSGSDAAVNTESGRVS